MKNAEYWKLRFEQLEQAQNQKGVAAYTEIEKQYKQAQKQLEGQISAWYQRFANNNGISLAEARQYLKGTALKEFKWDVQDYIKYGQDNALMGGWMKELENASAKYHISKLEALKMQTRQSLEVMFSKQLGTVTSTMGSVYESGFFHTAYEVQRGFGVGWDIAGLDQSQIEKVLSKPWAVDGKNFSERIWNNKEKLISEVHNQLTQNIMLGADPQKAIDAIAKKMNSSKSNAGKLVMTEEAFFSSAAQGDCFKELDVEQFEVVATLDSHTSEICRSLDGKKFPMVDYQPGVTAPPFHPWCRSTTVPAFEDDFGQIGKRAARGEDGKTYYVPSDMTYSEWKESFVDDVPNLTVASRNDIMKDKQKTLSEKIQSIKDDVAANGGIITEDHIKAAGKAVQDEIVASRAGFKKEWEDATAAYESSDIKKQIDELKKRRDALHKQYHEAPYGSEKRKSLHAEWEDAKSDYWKVHLSDEGIAFRLRIQDAKEKYVGTWKENADELSSKLSEFRTVGIGNHDLKKEHYSGRGTLRDIVTEAYTHYPAEWVEASIKKGALQVSKVSRGFYDGITIAIDGWDEEERISTAFHELGHRFEDVVKGIYEAEDVFYKRRTAGCKLEWLGSSHSRSEKTRKDNFIHPYMGKEYSDDFYELVSMGFDYAYTNPTKLWQDEDFAQFIYGILALK